MKKFDRDRVKPGDMLALALFPSSLLRFKGMGHDGQVIATWVNPQPNCPLDVILRQMDVLTTEKA